MQDEVLTQLHELGELPELLERDLSVELTLAQTGWLDGETKLEPLYTQFGLLFEHWLTEITHRFGAPLFTEASEPVLAQDWYEEARQLAVWRRRDAYFLLAFVHHDKETPIYLAICEREGQTLKQ
ncbi:hypothetical protein G7048_19780 [Diaphorobacter sp. HDW4B]|uniref:hypothetical protein n=1 Tax=Diaphorobacter sp. HDW4B TaxID=2714925 RepID=UPI001409AEB7|nr:hypothetical protein [Diaphorobacter sp. HDW4B]QIL72399.1 hypothetical protein G7048_19780 [Diaphorobacter sp. HDW4B]